MNLPTEFLEKMKNLLGQEYNQFIASYESKRYYGLRVNTLKISVDEFLNISPFKLEKIPWCDQGFYFNENDRPAKHPYYHAGLYYIQEPSAMAPGQVIPINTGDKVLDLCAAPGGKSTQIAAKLASKGVLVCNDNNSGRIKALVKNIEQYGITNAVITNDLPQRLARKFENYFDKIIVDAPCSGEGMFRKDDNAAKGWGKYSVDKCSAVQKDILEHASKMLAHNGYLLYSTCTFSPEENECIIDGFLKTNKNFELVDIPKSNNIESGRSQWCNHNDDLNKCARFWPHKLRGEGHFLALLKKHSQEVYKQNKTLDDYDINILKDFNDFCTKYLETSIEGNIKIHGEYIYLIPDKLPLLDGIKVIRPGWFLGKVKSGRFEPSHAFAMSLKTKEVKNIINMNPASYELIRYLKGETLQVKCQKGWNIVSVDGFPLGWAKGIDGILKNHYPVGWRFFD